MDFERLSKEAGIDQARWKYKAGVNHDIPANLLAEQLVEFAQLIIKEYKTKIPHKSTT